MLGNGTAYCNLGLYLSICTICGERFPFTSISFKCMAGGVIVGWCITSHCTLLLVPVLALFLIDFIYDLHTCNCDQDWVCECVSSTLGCLYPPPFLNSMQSWCNSKTSWGHVYISFNQDTCNDSHRMPLTSTALDQALNSSLPLTCRFSFFKTKRSAFICAEFQLNSFFSAQRNWDKPKCCP